jgi:DNA invertase Pin-like site-specific DNA recombinase
MLGLDAQHDALEKAGVDRIYQDTMSGTIDDRPGLKALLDYARPGDTITVVALDRLGRSLASIIRTVDELAERGIVVRSLRESVDFSTPVGRMIAGVFASLAEYERRLMLERVAAAREAARVRGRLTGRPRALTEEQAAVARQMREAEVPIPTIAATLGVSRATVYRVTASAVAEHDDGA